MGAKKLDNIVWQSQPGSQSLFLTCPVFECLYEGTRGPGKMLANDTPVLTPTGWRRHGELRRGQWVVTPNNERARVTHVFNHPNRECYEVEFDDGAKVIAGDEHLWKFRVVGHRRKIDCRWKWDDTMEMKRNLDAGRSVLIPTIEPVSMQTPPRLKELPVDPYLLGLLLGDGCFTQGRVIYCTVDDQLASYMLEKGFNEMPPDKRNGLRNFTNTGLKKRIKKLGLKNCNSKTKFVPAWYKVAPIDIRLSVLQGLMDTDGTCDQKGYISFCSASERLAKDVQYLARSLGAKATLTPKNEAWEVYIQPAGKFKAFRLNRKQDLVNGYMHDELCRRVVSIKPVGKRDCTCIRIDHPDHLYVVTDGFIVTHNTDTLLMDFAQHVGKGYGSDWKGILFRREYKELADVEKKSKKWFHEVFPNAKFLASQSEYKWRWPDGEELLFRHAKKEDDYWDYHGHEYPWIGWEELTLWPDEALYDTMKSVCRSSNPDVPRKYRATANPWGKGHHWVKQRFIDPAPAGTIMLDEQGRQRVRITGYIFENKFLIENDKEYILNIFGQKDENKRKAWSFADWDIAAGGFFADFWNAKKHVLPNFNIPSGWQLGFSFDWGSAKPASLGVWAITDGTQPDMPGLPYFPRGSAIRIDELYTVQTDRHGQVEANKGVEWSNNKLGREMAKRLKKWEEKTGLRFRRNVADPSIWTEEGGDSIHDQLVGKPAKDNQKATGARAEGYRLKMDKADNSREAGWGKMKEMLEEADKPRAESPGLWVMKRCSNFIRTVPVLPRDEKNPDDIDTEAEDHIADEARYFVMSISRDKKITTTKLKGF